MTGLVVDVPVEQHWRVGIGFIERGDPNSPSIGHWGVNPRAIDNVDSAIAGHHGADNRQGRFQPFDKAVHTKATGWRAAGTVPRSGFA